MKIHIGLLGGALVFFAIGIFPVWNQYTGVATRMTVESCHVGGSGGKTNGEYWNVIIPDCHGRPAGAPDQPSTMIWYAWWSDAGHDIDAHISSGGIATRDSWFPLVPIGTGCILLVGAVRAAVRRLRRAPT